MKRNDITSEKGSSNWRSVIPMREFNNVLNKQQFWDSTRLQYDWPIPGLSVSCSCGGFNVQHPMSCKNGGFVTLRHNEVRDITATLVSEVCKDVELEPSLLTLTHFSPVSHFYTPWKHQKTKGPNAQRYSKQILKKCYSINENEKKRHYNTRIMEVDQGSFTPLVFTVAGGIGREVRAFYSRLATLLSLKNGIEKSKVISWVKDPR